MSARPHRVVVIAGTATDIGKTWVSVELASRLVADSWAVEARKPAQSGGPDDPSDAALLAVVTGESDLVVCPAHRRYPVPRAPPMAAEATGLPAPTIEELASEVAGSWGVRAADVGLVELAGGVGSPAASDGDGAALAAAIAPDGVVLVADAGLGTINAVRLSVARLTDAGVVTEDVPVLVFLNRYDDDDDLHRRNRVWLADRDRFTVAVDVAAAVDWMIALVPMHCGYCGRPVTECDGACARPLDPDRFCVRCGRRLVVRVSPASHSATCKVHGSSR